MLKILLVLATTVLLGLLTFAVFAVAYVSIFEMLLLHALLLVPLPILYFWGDRFEVSVWAYLGCFTLVLTIITKPWVIYPGDSVGTTLLVFLPVYIVYLALLWVHSLLHRRLKRRVAAQ